MTCTMRTELGGYLLGAVTPAERAAVEAHLPGCSLCRDDIVALAPLPGLMARIDVNDLEDADPGPPELAPRTRNAGPAPNRPERVRWARIGPAAAAAVLVGGLVLVAVLMFGGPQRSADPRPVAATLTGTSETTGVHATATLTAQPWGTGIQLRLDGLPAADTCTLIVRADDGREETAGSWTANSYATLADVPAATSIAAGDIAALDVVTTDGQTLVHLTESEAPPS